MMHEINLLIDQIKIEKIIKLLLIKYIKITANNFFYKNKINLALKFYFYILDTTDDKLLLSNIYSNISACYMKLKDNLSSLNYSLQATTYNLKNTKAWARIGWSYKCLKIYNKSLQAFTIASNFNPNNNFYKKEISYLETKIVIDKNKVFDLFLNNSNILDKIKKNKKNILSGNITKEIKNLINYIIGEIN